MINKEKENVIRGVAKKYHKLLRDNNFFPDYNQELEFYDDVSTENSRTGKGHTTWEKYVLAVETSYFAMPYHLRKVIKCDYFYQNYSFWWEEFYTKKQYAQFKEEAVETFFSNLEKTKALEMFKDLGAKDQKEEHKARVLAANAINRVQDSLEELAKIYEEHSDVLNKPELNKNMPFKKSIDEFAQEFSNWFNDVYPADELVKDAREEPELEEEGPEL